jgi:hypothetical protein
MRILGVTASGVSNSGDFELIATTILGSTTNTVIFSNLGDYSTDYKHLQIRIAALPSGQESFGRWVNITFNGDTTTNYNWHELRGTGSSVIGPSGTNDASMLAFTLGNGLPSPAVVDILDPYSTTKNTTIRTFSGSNVSSPEVRLTSGLYRQTTAISSIRIFAEVHNFAADSRFSIYGIRG